MTAWSDICISRISLAVLSIVKVMLRSERMSEILVRVGNIVACDLFDRRSCKSISILESRVNIENQACKPQLKQGDLMIE